MSIRRWWHSIVTLPAWGDGLRALMTPSIGVLAGTLPQVPKVLWSDEIDTAYADRERGKIVISSKFFSISPTSRPNPNADKELTVEAVLGAVVHEGMHFVYSPKTCPDLLNSGLPVNDVTCGIANVLEDMFIEYQAPSLDKNYGWMIGACWEYFFPSEGMEERLAGLWDGVDTQNIEGIVNTMAQWKNQNFDFTLRTTFEAELFELCYSVRGMTLLQNRKDLIEKIIRLLINKEELEKQNQEQEGGEGEGEGGEGEGEGASGEEKETTFDVKGEKVTIIPRAGNGRCQDVIFSNTAPKFEDVGVDGSYGFVVRIVKPSSEKFVVRDIKKWDKLAAWQNDVGSVRTHRGVPGHYGRLTHPARLIDDGKVFSKTEKSSPSGRVAEGGAPQTIILDDFSGSMRGGIKGTWESKFESSLHVVGGAASALVKAKHRVAVYGHSTDDIGGREVCEVHRMKAFNESVNTLLGSLTTVSAAGPLANNADATAIEVVAKNFKFDGSRMILFVVSDGSPACDLYRGQPGIDATKKVVDRLRKNGIEVYSLCIDPLAMDANNEIYGSHNNFDVTDPRVADKVIKKVLGS